jgi:hypothetical protein
MDLKRTIPDTGRKGKATEQAVTGDGRQNGIKDYKPARKRSK